jgi:hypothetical protein
MESDYPDCWSGCTDTLLFLLVYERKHIRSSMILQFVVHSSDGVLRLCAVACTASSGRLKWNGGTGETRTDRFRATSVLLYFHNFYSRPRESYISVHVNANTPKASRFP